MNKLNSSISFDQLYKYYENLYNNSNYESLILYLIDYKVYPELLDYILSKDNSQLCMINNKLPLFYCIELGNDTYIKIILKYQNVYNCNIIIDDTLFSILDIIKSNIKFKRYVDYLYHLNIITKEDKYKCYFNYILNELITNDSSIFF